MIIDNNSRYDKQLKISYLGASAQQMLTNSHVAIIGLGALGSTVAEQLTRSGVGTITLIDRDYIELSNLQRQLLYTEEDVEQHLPKAIAAFNRLSQINSSIKLIPIVAHLNAANIYQYLSDVNLIIDASDNLEVRYLINEFATKENIVWIHGAVASTYGRVMSINTPKTPCFQCIYPQMPTLDSVDTCDTVGVLNSVVNVIASIQATEAIKWLTFNETYVEPTMIEFDIWSLRMMKLNVSQGKKDHCPICSQKVFQRLEDNLPTQTSSILCGRNTVQTFHHNLNESTYEHFTTRFQSKPNYKKNKYLCKFDIQDYVITFFPDGRCLVQGDTNLDKIELIMHTLFDY